jgi:hypothetical protein
MEFPEAIAGGNADSTRRAAAQTDDLRLHRNLLTPVAVTARWFIARPCSLKKDWLCSQGEVVSGGGSQGGETCLKTRSALAALAVNNSPALFKPPETTRSNNLKPFDSTETHKAQFTFSEKDQGTLASALQTYNARTNPLSSLPTTLHETSVPVPHLWFPSSPTTPSRGPARSKALIRPAQHAAGKS